MRGVKIDTVRFFNKVKVLMLRGERGERPSISENPIDNGYHVAFGYEDGEVLSFDLTNATSGNYSQLTNKPSINNVLLSGNKTTQDLLIDYDDLSSIPQINGVPLTGNKSSEDLGISDALKTYTFNMTIPIDMTDEPGLGQSFDAPSDFNKLIGVTKFRASGYLRIGSGTTLGIPYPMTVNGATQYGSIWKIVYSLINPFWGLSNRSINSIESVSITITYV